MSELAGDAFLYNIAMETVPTLKLISTTIDNNRRQTQNPQALELHRPLLCTLRKVLAKVQEAWWPEGLSLRGHFSKCQQGAIHITPSKNIASMCLGQITHAAWHRAVLKGDSPDLNIQRLFKDVYELLNFTCSLFLRIT